LKKSVLHDTVPDAELFMKPKTIVIGILVLIFLAALVIYAVVHLFSVQESPGMQAQIQALSGTKDLDLVMVNDGDASLNSVDIRIMDLEPVLTRLLSESDDLEPGRAIITAAADSIRIGSLLEVFGLFQEAGLNSIEFVMAGKKSLPILLAGISDDDSMMTGRRNICRIMLSSKSQLIVDDQTMDRRSLKKTLKGRFKKNPGLVVHVKADSGYAVSDYYSLLKTIKDSGINTTVFVNERKPVYFEANEEITDEEGDYPDESPEPDPDLPPSIPSVE
jgi:biopolymer transport protein ExbD